MTKALIIDANSFGKNLHDEVLKALRTGKIKAILSRGGKFEDELRTANMKRYAEYRKQNIFHYVCDVSVKRKYKQLKQQKSTNPQLYKSDDPHVLALAIVSAANTLVSSDRHLCDDFKQCEKIDQESGCLPNQGLPTTGKRKLIMSKGSLDNKKTSRIIKNAKAKSCRCQCQCMNGGGC